MSKFRITALSLMAACAMASVSAPASATVIPAYFGWNYVADSAGSPPAVMDLTSVTYTGGAGAGLVLTMPAFPGYAGMPDGIGLSYAPTFMTGGDGETTRTLHVMLPIDWAPAGSTPWGTYAFPTIGITNFSMADGRVYTVDSNTANQLGSPLAYYVVGLSGNPSELYSTLPAPQGDIYDYAAGAVGNPQLTATDTPGFSSDQITVIFAVPEPASLALLGLGLAALGAVRRKRA